MQYTDALFRERLEALPPQSHPLALAAVHGLTATGFPTKEGMCSMWTRLCWEHAYGDRYQVYPRNTAILAGWWWQRHGLNIPLANGSQAGDLLYKMRGSGGSGHVGIRLLGNMVAENSSISDRHKDGRNLRTFDEFGDYDLIVRLPRNLNLNRRG